MFLGDDSSPKLCCGLILIDTLFGKDLGWPSMSYIFQVWELLLLSDAAADVPENKDPIATWIREADWCMRFPCHIFLPRQASVITSTLGYVKSMAAGAGIDLFALPAHQRLRLCAMYAHMVPLSPALFVQVAHAALVSSKVQARLQVTAGGPTMAGTIGYVPPPSPHAPSYFIGNVAAQLTLGHWVEADFFILYPPPTPASFAPPINDLEYCSVIWGPQHVGMVHYEDPGDMWPGAILFRGHNGLPLLSCGVLLLEDILELPSWSVQQAHRHLIRSEQAADASNTLALWLYDMLLCLESPQSIWHPPLAQLAQFVYGEARTFSNDWPSLSTGARLDTCRVCGLSPLSPQLLIAVAHEALCHAGQYRWLQIRAAGVVRAGWVGRLDGHNLCGPDRYSVAAELVHGHWDCDTLDSSAPQGGVLPISSLEGAWPNGVAGLGCLSTRCASPPPLARIARLHLPA